MAFGAVLTSCSVPTWLSFGVVAGCSLAAGDGDSIGLLAVDGDWLGALAASGDAMSCGQRYDQKMSFSASWSCREDAAAVICPAEALYA